MSGTEVKPVTEQAVSPAEKPAASLHDWIKTIATVIQALVLVLGVGFAIYEFRLGSRAKEIQRREATFALIQEMNDATVAKAQTAATQALDPLKIAEWRKIEDPAELSQKGRELADQIAPWLMKVGTVQACIASDLCDPDLALRAFCPRVMSIQAVSQRLEEGYSRQLGEVFYKFDLGADDVAFVDMMRRCQERNLA